MGLIRSENTNLTVSEDKKLTEYLWNIVKEIIKTNIENDQNIIIEGCYIPFDWKKYFKENYLKKIKYICLIMTEEYIKNNFNKIIEYENSIENRIVKGDININKIIEENKYNLEMCKRFQNKYILIDKKYKIDLDL